MGKAELSADLRTAVGSTETAPRFAASLCRPGRAGGAGRAAGAAWRPVGNNAAPRSAAAASQRRGAGDSRGPSAPRAASGKAPEPDELSERERSAVPRGEANAEFMCTTDIFLKRTCKTCVVAFSCDKRKSPLRQLAKTSS